MSYTLSPDTLNLWTKIVSSVVLLGRIWLGRSRGFADAENVGPLQKN
jgi:hypothetical protein